MSLPVLIQARMGSTRLPGKSLVSIGGETLLERQVRRLREAGFLDLTILTSSHEGDAPLVLEGRRLSVPVYRGSHEDVASRFVEVLFDRPDPYFVRYCADRPFFDPELLDEGISYLGDGDVDLVTNVFPSTFPKGQTVEILSRSQFLATYPEFPSDAHREHVTSFFYESAARFRIRNFAHEGEGCHDLTLTIDTPDDYERSCALLSVLPNPRSPSWREVAEALRTWSAPCVV